MRQENGTKSSIDFIAGPNGAGKATFATKSLPDFTTCREFLNADLISARTVTLRTETQNVLAGRLLPERIRELASARRDLGFETTLSGRTYRRLLERLKSEGYSINLFFPWLPRVEMAVNRVANRVRQGGHNIPEPDIRRHYQRGL